MTPRGFSIVRFVLQHLLGERPIEELDEGPKAERTDQGAKAHKATQQPAQQGAERIGEDAAPEVRAGCVVPQTEGKVIVGRDAEVGGLVERSAQRRDQHRRDDPRQLHRQRRRVAEVGVNGVIERRDDVPDADAVDEGAKADVLAPEPEFQQEKQDVRAQVLGAQRDAEQLRQPHVQGADGVVAEVGLLEKRNAKGDDDDARHHAHHPPGSRFAQCGAVHREFSFSASFPLLYACAGQWGASMAMAAKHFGLELAVYMVKVSYNQKPYRRSIMQTFGAEVIASPSMSTRAGRDIITKHPNYQGSLGTAISEAVELAMQTPNCKYVLGSVLNHVMLHQTVIGLEAEKQMEMAGECPDVVIACFGGGSNFSGIAFPFLRHKLTQGKNIRIVAAEPASCPKLTRGQFQYDFGDEAGYTPLLPMFTLGHNFAPANIHAGGLRYHGAGSIVSQLKKDGLMDAVDIQQLETFKAATLFAQSEGIIPAPESSHAIAAAIREAEQAKIEGKPRTILFNLSGHGLIDMAAYDQYLAGDLTNYEVTDADVEKNLSEIEKIIK